jgi:hypothetical protein
MEENQELKTGSFQLTDLFYWSLGLLVGFFTLPA